jgi:hypothetical protein
LAISLALKLIFIGLGEPRNLVTSYELRFKKLLYDCPSGANTFIEYSTNGAFFGLASGSIFNFMDFNVTLTFCA